MIGTVGETIVCIAVGQDFEPDIPNTRAKCLCTILGGQASRRARVLSGSDRASPSRNHARPHGLAQFRVVGTFFGLL